MSTDASWDDDLVILPDTTTDETATGWGEGEETNDQRLAEERPPHWS